MLFGRPRFLAKNHNNFITLKWGGEKEMIFKKAKSSIIEQWELMTNDLYGRYSISRFFFMRRLQNDEKLIFRLIYSSHSKRTLEGWGREKNRNPTCIYHLLSRISLRNWAFARHWDPNSFILLIYGIVRCRWIIYRLRVE